ncbi:MAG: Fic family protein, partial [Bryobacteraceae bacterium]
MASYQSQTVGIMSDSTLPSLMMWNWQQSDWPNFTWDEARLRKAEQEFPVGAGVLSGMLKHLDADDQQQFTIETISTEALTTSEIEGEILDRASVQSSVRRLLGLTSDNRRVAPAERAISEMMVNLYSSFADPLSHEVLFSWHWTLFGERGNLSSTGEYRTSNEPMQVISGAIAAPKVHFEGPPSSRVPKEMTQFLAWFNRTAPSGEDPLPTLTRAGIAHVYFESIHPFEDGNGRIGRGIAEKVLAQSFGQPTLTGLAGVILSKRKAYYRALEEANKDNELTAWLAWFAGMAIEAQRRTIARLEFLIDKSKLMERMRGKLNRRQEEALLRMLREGPDGFKGGLSATNYISITGASAA